MSLPQQSKYDHNFVSQDQIDSLLKGSDEFAFPDGKDPLGDIADFINTDEIDRLLGDDDPDDAPDPYSEDEMTEEPLPEDDGFEDEELSMISMDDIQRVLSEGDPEAPEEAPLDDLNLNLEEIEDIAGEDSSEGESDLISQDDIDRLLKSSGVQSDDVTAEVDEGFQISREEIDTILTDTTEDSPEARDEEILRKDSPAEAKEQSQEAGEEELPPEVPRSKKKLFLIAAGFLLLFICGGGAGWFYLMRGVDDLPSGETIPGIEEGVGGTPAPGVPGEPQVVSRLDHFLIPAPQGSDYAFVSMSVVLTIRGVKKDPLKGYETFCRKRIYDEMAAKLSTLSGEKPVERELRELVRKTAGAILTEGVIDEVVLEGYRLM
ncbi:hypothetical protein DSLASN_49190 [Desulfoluna limicola]|uniref:Flagellar protein FliL n=1 Tax=Desulfoluna limicola TaxID=2810562 RepID=A0ABM7PPD9_9BACT|nr:hypothetical protein [Desulfoluna limicola]BCS99287.1 hypothetical protein DSLASN_49190 [Desulfoluna limicola]